MAYILSLLFFLDVFSNPMWSDLTHVQDPYLHCLADKLPEVVLGARADNTTLTYLYSFNPLVTRVANIVPYGSMTYFLSKQCSFNITDSILH